MRQPEPGQALGNQPGWARAQYLLEYPTAIAQHIVPRREDGRAAGQDPPGRAVKERIPGSRVARGRLAHHQSTARHGSSRLLRVDVVPRSRSLLGWEIVAELSPSLPHRRIIRAASCDLGCGYRPFRFSCRSYKAPAPAPAAAPTAAPLPWPASAPIAAPPAAPIPTRFAVFMCRRCLACDAAVPRR
jgi:hypothetical protein